MKNSRPLDTSQLSAIIDKYSPFFVEARNRILFTLVFFALATIAGFVFYEKIIRFLIGTLSLGDTNIVFTSPFQFINLAISCGIVTGIVLVIPILIIQILFFLKPALRAKEFKMVVRALPFSGILFVIGFVFGALIMKWQIDIFLIKSASLGIGNVLDISSLLSLVLLTSVLMGIGFQFPIILLILMRLRVISRIQLAGKRMWVYLTTFIFTLFLPPDSVLADIILSLPFIISFEITLILDRLMDRKSS